MEQKKTPPMCPAAKKCGGCQLANMDYEQQLRYKQGKAISLLGSFAHVEPIFGMDAPYHYRCKVQAAFSQGRGGILSGVWQSSSRRVVPIDSCLLEDELADRIVVTVRKLMTSFKLKAWHEPSGTGFLRHVLVRRGYYTGQVMVVLVTAKEQFPSKQAFVNALVQKHPEITTVVQSVNDSHTNLLLGKVNNTLYGAGYIEDSILGAVFRISPKSFYQVNPVMTEQLYATALSYLGSTKNAAVLDAYCGTGTIGILAARSAGQVIGVESNPDAVRDAIRNAKRNGTENIRFVRADASAYLEDMAKNGDRLDAVIMDPPRAGSDPRFLKAVAAIAPKKIVYVSCNPETLARDLAWLTKHSYAVQKIQPVDMFPHTRHVECVVLLKKNPAHSVVLNAVAGEYENKGGMR